MGIFVNLTVLTIRIDRPYCILEENMINIYTTQRLDKNEKTTCVIHITNRDTPAPDIRNLSYDRLGIDSALFVGRIPCIHR